jgi:oligosaccharide translocation protein RFT1
MDSFVRFWSASFLLQTFSRLLSFASNQFLVRLLIPDHYGLWSVNLPLISELIVFWSRDGVRKAATRSVDSIYKYSLLPFLIGLPVSILVLALSLLFAPDVPGFPIAVILTGLGSLLELVGEVWAVPQLALLEASGVARVSSMAFLGRSFSVVVLVRLFFFEGCSTVRLMLIFGLANCLFGLLTVLLFLWISGRPRIDPVSFAELRALRPFVFQSGLQVLFSQGERMVLLWSSTAEQIGIYGFVSDLSSLVVRLVFAPIEASVFSVCASRQTAPVDEFCLGSRIVLYVGLSAAAFGPSLGLPVLNRVYGEKWSGPIARSTFAAFCRVMPFMSLNGVTEAFANARLAAAALELYNLKLTGVTVVYFALMFVLARLFGPAGAIYANGVNMSLRSAMAIQVVVQECGWLRDLFPPGWLVAMEAIAAVAAHFGGWRVALPAAPIVVAGIVYSERKWIKNILGMFRSSERKVE